jgi:hypothetical protein
MDDAESGDDLMFEMFSAWMDSAVADLAEALSPGMFLSMRYFERYRTGRYMPKASVVM